MNKQRRKRLEEAIEQLQEAFDVIEKVGIEEREAFDNLPEGLQQSERGKAMEATADSLEDLAARMTDIIDEINEIVEG